MSYVYRHAEVVRVIDGDTVSLEIDMGNHIWWTDHFRLLGIDTPERGQPGYAEATEYLRGLLSGSLARVETFKPDKYGRWLAELWIAADGGELLVNKLMVLEGFAKAYDGGAR